MSAKEIKDDRQYTKDHEWAKRDGKEVLIGISAFAVDQLGDITMVSLDVQEGDEIQKGQAFGTIESVKTLSDLFAPLSGKVTRINPNLDDQPELVNADPWGQGWMLALEPSAFDAEQGDLLDAEQYGKHLEDSDH
ncbi:MAG: glycine cleavage system protein GcvH [Myxococcales bacterium]|jgi:glycine cleavage system H protein|nr:glycine cleavage system protein GcvH [Myxococcales bacterium]